MVSCNHLTFCPCSLALTLSRARERREEGYVGGPYGIRVAFQPASNILTFTLPIARGLVKFRSSVPRLISILPCCRSVGMVSYSTLRRGSPRTPWLSRRNRSSAVRSCGLVVVSSSPYLRAGAAGALWRLDSPQRASFKANSTAPMPYPRCSRRWKVAGVVTVRPASTGRTTPVTQRASSLAR